MAIGQQQQPPQRPQQASPAAGQAHI